MATLACRYNAWFNRAWRTPLHGRLGSLMSEQEFTAVISQTAQEVFRQPSIPFSPALLFHDIPGFDSVLAIQFILTIETAFEVTLNEEEVDTMHTMGDLLTLLKAKKTS
jgi:acyl carrier protein